MQEENQIQMTQKICSCKEEIHLHYILEIHTFNSLFLTLAMTMGGALGEGHPGFCTAMMSVPVTCVQCCFLV